MKKRIDALTQLLITFQACTPLQCITLLGMAMAVTITVVALTL